MTDQEIIDNAPEGATHVDNNGYYLKAGRSGFMEPSDCGLDWDYDYANHTEVRSLADIKRIVELEKNNDTLYKLMVSGEKRGVDKATQEFELSRKDLIEEFAEAECMGDLAKIARNYGYVEQGE